MKSRIICCVSCISPPITIGSIPWSHVYIVTYTLGWDDGTSLTSEVEGKTCDCYAKCEKVPSCPISPISYSTPINVPWHPRSNNCQGCTCHVVTSCRNPTLRRVWGWNSHSQNGDLGVLRDSQNFRVQLQGSEHLALGRSLYLGKTVEM
jgi:hypothetical protein